MRITHLGHACLLVDTGDARILIDPGVFSAGFSGLADIDAVLITHQAADHFDPGAVATLLEANPGAPLVVERATARRVPGTIDPGRVRVVAPGDEFDVNGVDVLTVGGTHARIHADIECIPNVGFYFGGTGLLHPGDEFSTPVVDVELLALPVAGPWQSLADAVDYLRTVNPARAFPVHEATLAEPGIYYDYLTRLTPSGTAFRVLPQGTPAEF